MTVRRTLWILGGAGLALAAGLVLLVLETSPRSTPAWGFALVTILVWGVVTLAATILGTMLRRHRHAQIPSAKHLARSLRQGVLVGAVFVGALWLSAWGALTWWGTLLLMLAALAVEWWVLSKPSRAS